MQSQENHFFFLVYLFHARLLRLLNVFKRALQLHWLMAAITSGEE